MRPWGVASLVYDLWMIGSRNWWLPVLLVFAAAVVYSIVSYPFEWVVT